IGRNQHVLVGQGQVGDVLNARPEDHRAVIEEAAGVTKHRSRRERALRRLERTDHDVERLNDILGQQRKALRPLKRQANAAARHDSVRDEARAIRLFLGGEELRSIRSRLGTAAREREEALELRDESDAGLTRLKDDLERLRGEAGEVGAALTRDTAAAARLETVRERLHRFANVARERRRSYESRAEGADERREDLALEQADLRNAIAEADASDVRIEEEADRRASILRTLEDEERSLTEQIQLPAESVVANLRGDLRSLETANQRDAAERSQVAQRIEVVKERIADEAAETARLNESIQSLDGRTHGLQQAYDLATKARAETQTGWEQRSDEAASNKVDVARAIARVEAIESALDGLVDEQARDIAQGSDGVDGGLVAALDVPTDVAAAVDAALGQWRDAYLASSDEAVVEAAGAVKAVGSGGVAFVTSRSVSDASATAVAKEFGVDRLVDRLGPSADASLAESYLGGVVLVEGWKTAHGVVAVHPQITAVTPEGDVITAHGMIVSHPDGAGPAALEAARVGVEIAERDLKRTESLLTAATRAFETARDNERTALEELEAAEAELAGFSEALAMVDRSRAASQAECERLVGRVDAIDDAAEARAERIDGLRARVEEFEGEEAARQEAWDALNERRQDVAEQRDEARRAVEAIAAERASILERRRLSESRLAAVDAELAQLTLLPESADDIANLGVIEESAEAAVVSVSAHIETLRTRQRELRTHVGTANGELARAEAEREALDEHRRTSSDALAALDVELAELRVRLEATAEGLRREVDADEQIALDASMPELAEGMDMGERLEALEADLRRMGPINPLAAHEHAELAAQVDELESQLADLNQSRDDIKQVITALDEKMEVLFAEAFDEIARLYHENFSLVFPGGTGSLRLTDPNDPLNAGVLVQAQPAGKKVGRLSLLSGGERSLAALAFLFAVFRARPSPFYVLDEVEAALDDANLHRFLRLVDTLRKDTQLVIITHQQQTMEAADVLYGVTMEPGDTSKVLSKRMTPISV
ncbi:MAG: AAA family ATPase, partial [Acidimicrobiia bacterium]